ncbi:MAG: glycosyltransferase family 1 protein [Gammaproteobacteria bacterium]|nr:MAG: glycosyltransferase family 1 protein [Gammaproteobacteria bacterium]
MTETRFKLEVQPRIPPRLAGLEILANDLQYSWDRGVRGLYHRLDPSLWRSCGHNPKVFLRRVSQQTLDEAAEDNVFLEEYNGAISAYETYQNKLTPSETELYLNPEQDLVAYFCAEFGFHESFPIYSGGLGILAGDHCKAASDLGIPFVAIGLLYRQGYFQQTIDASGHQIAHNISADFNDLPIEPAVDENGNEIHVTVELADNNVHLKVWQAKAGHITLYLLDSDLPDNKEDDRSITFQLYGGDRNNRIQQEIVLGIGGVRALRKLGLQPNVWHINEGHAAFQILERCREHVGKGLDFDSAFELVAAGTTFTTHTPVAAGHDIFDESLMAHYFSQYIGNLGIDLAHFMSLGSTPDNHGSFNMTALALRGSRFHNGVSRIHGEVASQMEGYIWPQVPHNENPISYVTNGVHVPTFLAREWVNLFDMRFREWRNELINDEYWSCVDEIPDHRFWSLRQELKSRLLKSVYHRSVHQYRRNGYSEGLLKRITEFTSQHEGDFLVMGFARRFATYKRATLLFSDPERLARLLNNPERPVLLIYAGKAHPRDIPGQELICQIHEYSLRPEFIGKIILLEGYNLSLARKLVAGVDVWLNTPVYPMEASGTSGQKAAINGVVNLSVLDGWWGEGYSGNNGWAIEPHGAEFDPNHRDKEEATDLLDIIEEQVIPLFYDRGSQGYSSGWVKISKASMKYCIPRFNAARMVMDYVKNFYSSARNHYKLLADNDAEPARELAAWKKKVSRHWSRVSMQRIDEVRNAIKHDEILPIQISAQLNGLSPEDVAVECLVGTEGENGEFLIHHHLHLEYREQKGEEHIFYLDLRTSLPGLNYYKIRMYPYHQLLGHNLETGYMIWL